MTAKRTTASRPDWDERDLESSMSPVVKIGDHVGLHPATDRWMRGDKFGVVTSTSRAGAGSIGVKFDRSGQSARVHPKNITRLNGDMVLYGVRLPEPKWPSRKRVANPRAPSKTVEVLVIQSNYGYGHGWEDSSEYEKSDRKGAAHDLKGYRLSGQGSHRLITRRVPRTAAVANPSKRGRKAPKRTAAQRSASARKGARTRARNAGKRR